VAWSKLKPPFDAQLERVDDCGLAEGCVDLGQSRLDRRPALRPRHGLGTTNAFNVARVARPAFSSVLFLRLKV
jgi:hypothetical protein